MGPGAGRPAIRRTIPTEAPRVRAGTVTSSESLPDGLGESRRAWMAAVKRTDLAAYADLVCDDVVWLPPGRPAFQGRGAFRDWLAPFFEAYAYELDIEDSVVRVAGGWAVETGDFRSRMTSHATGETMEHAGSFIVLWRRDDDGRWRIERYMDVTPGEAEA